MIGRDELDTERDVIIRAEDAAERVLLVRWMEQLGRQQFEVWREATVERARFNNDDATRLHGLGVALYGDKRSGQPPYPGEWR